MKMIFRIAALAVVLMGIAGADEARRQQVNTCNMYNGRWWQELDETGRLGYLSGVLDMTIAEEDPKSLWPAGMNVREMALSLDKVYSDPANMRIPVVFGLGIAGVRFKGATPQDIAGFEVSLRRYAVTCKWEDNKKMEIQ